MRIKKLELKNFRGFEDLTIDFPEGESGLAVFVGVNGSGKTSVIESILDIVHLFYFNILRSHYVKSDIVIQFFGNRLVNKSDIKHGADKLKIKSKLGFPEFGIYDFDHEVSMDGGAESWPDPVSWMLDLEKVEKEYGKEKYLELKSIKELMLKNISFFKYYPTSRHSSKTPSLRANNDSSFSRLDIFNSAFDNRLNFDDFFEWVRNTEDYENEQRLYTNPDFRHRGLEAVRNAFSIFIPQIQKLRVQRRPSEELVVEKDGNVIPFVKLSDGEKSLFTLVGDIIRRLDLTYHLRQDLDLLKMPGVVLIDEIEQHLHPKWQRDIIKNLRATFPNIQFILTTHSPQVISTLQRENVFILDNFQLVPETPHTYGRDSNSILYDIFGVEKRPTEAKQEFAKLYRLMDDPAKVSETADLLHDAEAKYGYYDEEVVRARGQFQFLNEA